MKIARVSDRLQRFPRGRRDADFPRAVATAMIYVFVVAFVLLYLRTWLVMVSQVGGLAALRAWTWDVQGGAAHLRWSFAVVGALLLLYLWSSSRAHLRADGESRGFRRLYVLLHLGAAILVLFCQWALVVALRGIPELTLTRLYP